MTEQQNIEGKMHTKTNYNLTGQVMHKQDTNS